MNVLTNLRMWYFIDAIDWIGNHQQQFTKRHNFGYVCQINHIFGHSACNRIYKYEYFMQQQKNGKWIYVYNLSFVYTFRKESILEMRIGWLWLHLAFGFHFILIRSFVSNCGLSAFAYGTKKKYEILMRVDLSRFMKMHYILIFSILDMLDGRWLSSNCVNKDMIPI